jgi:hypothetical protein
MKRKLFNDITAQMIKTVEDDKAELEYIDLNIEGNKIEYKFVLKRVDRKVNCAIVQR